MSTSRAYTRANLLGRRDVSPNDMTVSGALASLDALNESNFPQVPLSDAGAGTVIASYRQNILSSVYQPVMVPVTGVTVGHAARARSSDEGRAEQSALGVFALTGPDHLVVQLDRAVRTLHALNYFPRAGSTWRLFLRVQPRLLASVVSGHGRVFERILGNLGVPTKDVVIEIPRHFNEDPALYVRALLSYRSLGYRVASDWLDFDDPLLEGRYDVIPDIVAIDHRWLPNPGMLGSSVERIQQRGAAAMVKFVETAAALDAATAAGADLAQGFHLGRPVPGPEIARLHGAAVAATPAASSAAG